MSGPHPGISSASISGYGGGSYFQDAPPSAGTGGGYAPNPGGNQSGIAASQLLSQPGPMDFRGLGLGMMTSSRFVNNNDRSQPMFGPYGSQRQQPQRQGEFDIAFRKEMTTPDVGALGTLLPDYSADPSSPLHVEPDYETDSGISLQEWSASMATTVTTLAAAFEGQQDVIAHHHELYARKQEEQRRKRNNPFGMPTAQFGYRLG